jgi:hypothetical protein
MTTTPRLIFRRWAGAVLAAASLVGALAGCSLASQAAGLDSPVPSTATPSLPVTPPTDSTSSVRIVLRFGDESAAATLADTPAAREFAATLPVELNLRDPMGQAKSGRLPRPLDVSSAEPVFDPAVGQIYYSATSATFAVFYDDLGQSIPDPGLVRLGAVDTGMDRIADAGNRFPVRIDLADHTQF